MCLPFGPTTSTTSSSSNSASTPRPTPTLNASKPSFAEPTSSPSASCTRTGNTISSLLACPSYTFFTAVPPLDLRRIAHHAPKRSGRAGGTANLLSSTSYGTSSDGVVGGSNRQTL